MQNKLDQRIEDLEKIIKNYNEEDDNSEEDDSE
jgi:hypothetical protein